MYPRPKPNAMDYKFCPMCASPLIVKEMGGRKRLKCTSTNCDFIFWDNPTPVVAAIVEHNGQVILTQNKGWSPSWWGIVAGFLEKGETPEEGVLREVQEELGLQGKIVSFIGHYSFEQKNQIIFAYHIQAEGEIIIGEELEQIKIMPLNEIKPWALGTGPALRDWLESQKAKRNITYEAKN